MAFKIRILEDPIPIAEISNLFQETYYKQYFEAGANQWNPEYTEWYFGAFHHDKRFFYSAWKDEHLIATLLGTPLKIKFQNEVTLNVLALGLTATWPEYQRQGIQKILLEKLIQDAKASEIDFIYGFPIKGFGGIELLKKFDFKTFLKNQEHYIKIIGNYGIKILREYRGLNAVLAQLVKLYSGIPKDELHGGEIRDGIDTDIEAVVALLNSYQTRMPLSQIWNEDHYRQELENERKLNDLGDHYAFYWKVWERDNQILGTVSLRSELVTFTHGSAPAALVSKVCCAEETTLEERTGFLATIIRWVLENWPEAFIFQSTEPQYEMKLFKKLGFTDDTSTYEFLILTLTENGELLKKYSKYKEFRIPYYR